MKNIPSLMVCTALLVMLQSCSTPPTTPVSIYDFGALPTSGNVTDCTLPAIHVADISSPPALETNLMQYRLLYNNDQQSRAYAGYRWSMTPAQLLTLRIKAQLASMKVNIIDSGVANSQGWQLRLDLTDFGQYFSDASHSTAQLQLRASVVRANNLIAQSTFTRQSAATLPDAPSGAQAMRLASDALISDLNNWLCKLPHQ